MKDTLIVDIRRWLADFETTQPANLSIDDTTFEGSAYCLLQRVLPFLAGDDAAGCDCRG